METIRKSPTVPGHVVRVVVNNGDGTRKVLLGYVLSVGLILPTEVGTSGEPTITALVLDPTPANLKQLGRADWHQALTRLVGLRHYSHDDVVSGRQSSCYVDTMASEDLGLDLNLDDNTRPVKEIVESQYKIPDAPAQDHSAIRSVNPLIPDGSGLSQHEAHRKAAETEKAATEGKGVGIQEFEPQEVYHSEKTGVSVETMVTGTFCCYDKDEKLITHQTDGGASTMVFPTKETAVEFADAFGADSQQHDNTQEATGKEQPAPVS
jgi:hypothetical protein